MGLGIYSIPHEDSLLTTFTITFDGRLGGVQDKCVYVRNNNGSRWYSSIKISAVDTQPGSAGDITDYSRSGWSWRLMEKDVVPKHEEWDAVTPGATLSLASNLGTSLLSDTTTYLPVWIRVEIPRGQQVQTVKQVVLRLNATENLL